MIALIKAAQLILSLSIMVVLHEFGHFITARMFKTRVEKFYLFFDFLFPLPNVLNFALFKKQIGETEYGIGWFPLGGYVKIAGMIDESMDEEFLKSEPQPWEFRSKPAWQRLIIMLGGIIVNVLLAITIFSGIFYFYGDSYVPFENVKYGYAIDSTGQKIGLKDGDKILTYDGGKKFKNIQTVGMELLINNARSIEVNRDGRILSLPVPASIFKEILDSKGADFASPFIPCVVDSVLPGSALAKAGGKPGDRIIQIDTVHTSYYQQFKRAIPHYKNDSTYLLVLRGPDTVKLNVVIPDSAIVGFMPQTRLDTFFKTVDKKYTLISALPAGAVRTWESLVSYIKQFRIIFNPALKGYKQVGSFLTIGQQFAPKWDWLRFWNLTAFLSIALAFVNVLPIPALDGGHALFTLVEMVTGKAPSEKFQERAQAVGMIIILGLMVFAIGNDVMRTFFGGW
jgi:regulator of sigma E protease